MRIPVGQMRSLTRLFSITISVMVGHCLPEADDCTDLLKGGGTVAGQSSKGAQGRDTGGMGPM